mmetsp:Transcript_35119/g.80914  ORF Transcript_35119/g.80914 Transcript_35119/m.80914 type:complete len:272 (+) Transcript_35119:79-894(+)
MLFHRLALLLRQPPGLLPLTLGLVQLSANVPQVTNLLADLARIVAARSLLALLLLPAFEEFQLPLLSVFVACEDLVVLQAPAQALFQQTAGHPPLDRRVLVNHTLLEGAIMLHALCEDLIPVNLEVTLGTQDLVPCGILPVCMADAGGGRAHGGSEPAAGRCFVSQAPSRGWQRHRGRAGASPRPRGVILHGQLVHGFPELCRLVLLLVLDDEAVEALCGHVCATTGQAVPLLKVLLAPLRLNLGIDKMQLSALAGEFLVRLGQARNRFQF